MNASNLIFHYNKSLSNEIKDTPCSSNPCFNNSICQTGPNGAFLCVCPSGYSGPLCQNCKKTYIQDLKTKKYYNNAFIYLFAYTDNPCFNYPCQNKATCQTNGNNYLCICPQFFSGRNCEICKH
jgi:hypothetical protein